MGIHGFLDYIERNCQQACTRVDLGQLARKRLNNAGKRGRALVGQDPLLLVIDANSCLHRLYGGSFTDWVCGGQWNSMFHFIDNLARASRSNNMKLIVVFNGSLEKNRIPEWLKQEIQTRNTVGQVLGHVHNKGTPPPKAWFTPPVALGTYKIKQQPKTSHVFSSFFCFVWFARDRCVRAELILFSMRRVFCLCV